MTLQSTETYSLRSIGGVLKMALTFGIFGLVTAFVIAFNPDVLLTGIITLTYFTFALVTALLTQHGATIFSVTDHVILGPRPVSSRTLFAIRLTNVLFHTLLTTTFMAYPAIIAFTVAHGVNPWRGLAGAVAIYGWTATVAFAVMAGVRLDSSRRWRRSSPADPRVCAAGHRGLRLRRVLLDDRSVQSAVASRVHLARQPMAAPFPACLVCELSRDRDRRGHDVEPHALRTRDDGPRGGGGAAFAAGWRADTPSESPNLPTALRRDRSATSAVRGCLPKANHARSPFWSALTFATTSACAWAFWESLR